MRDGLLLFCAALRAEIKCDDAFMSEDTHERIIALQNFQTDWLILADWLEENGHADCAAAARLWSQASYAFYTIPHPFIRHYWDAEERVAVVGVWFPGFPEETQPDILHLGNCQIALSIVEEWLNA